MDLRRFRNFSLATAAMGILAAASPAWSAATENHVLRALPAPGVLTIDGDLSNWDLSGAIVIADDVENPTHAVRVSAMYDAEGFCLAFEFRDPTPMLNHMNPKTQPGCGWCGDCVQLRLNLGPDGTSAPVVASKILHVDCYWYTEGKQPAAYVVYGDMSYGGTTLRTIEQPLGQGVDAAFKMAPDGRGYVQEMRLRWKLLRPKDGTPFKAGDSIRMAIEPMWIDRQSPGAPAYRLTDLLNPKPYKYNAICTDAPGWGVYGGIYTEITAWGTVELLAEGHVPPDATAQRWPEIARRADIAGQTNAPENRPCLSNQTEVMALLNRWFAEGTAAGNAGDFYDNRDRGHAHILMANYPQLRKVGYTQAQLADQFDYALSLVVLPHVTVGNSSTACGSETGGCNPRFAEVNNALMTVLWSQYRNGNLFVYPGCSDYAPGHAGHGRYGDMLPLNMPYLIISNGISSSDTPFVNAAFHTFAALRPGVKRLLIERGLLMPTFQAIFRASNKQVVDPADYFTGKAHPPVFRNDQIDELKMVNAAHALTEADIPPLVQLRVVAEDAVPAGIGAPAKSGDERLCDTPEVIARIHRRWARTMTLRVSAADSFDLASSPLKFRWVLLQGDPARVKIEPSADGKEAQLTLAWHDRFPVQPGGDLGTNRVDIGVFAGNGRAWSAPAFVCVDYPDNELRTYDGDRLVDIHYNAGDTAIGFPSTLLFFEYPMNYDVRDWFALGDIVAGKGDGFARQIFRGALSDAQRAKIGSAIEEVRSRLSQVEAARKEAGVAPEKDKPLVASLTRQENEWCSEPLRRASAEAGPSVKDILEVALNAWKDDPMSYLDHREQIDADAARQGPPTVQKLEAARQRLVKLGIYQPKPAGEGWTLHSVREGSAPDVARLTQYERLELKRFHLALLTDALLPKILVRNYLRNTVDQRLVKVEPVWEVFQNVAPAPGKPPISVRRRTDDPIPPSPLEEP